jgi:GT2 family glycosyltransferase
VSPDPLPPDVRRLLGQRSEARAASDWARADALRDELIAKGWEPQDRGARSTARPILAVVPDVDEREVSFLGDPATVAASIQLTAEEHADDLERFLRGLAMHPPSATWELVVVANDPPFDVAELVARVSPGIDPVIVSSPERLGWADARTLGLRHSRGAVTILLDTSVEPVGDFTAPLLAAFEDPSIGIAGGWGVTSGNGRQFEDAAPGEVDAVEGYCLAIRREALRAVGGFDRRFRFYRNADLDLSFAVRDAGWRALRTEALPLERHEHRGWASLPDDERDRLSKRNFYRFLDHWGDRRDLLLHPEVEVDR